MTVTTAVRAHERKRPHAAAKAQTTAKLTAEYEAWLSKQLLASLRTFPINVKRAHAAGRL